jgi:hypothetical protein
MPNMPDTTTMAMAPKGSQGGRRMSSPSLETASRIADWANVFFIASLVVGVVSTILIVWMANVKEEHWNELRRKSDEKIAEANERAAQLEKQAADARLELMQLQNPRMIFPDKLAAGLAGKPTAKVEIWYVSECSDCHWLATWLAGGLLAAGWEIDQGKPLPIPPATSGIDTSGAPAAAKGGQPWGVSVLPSDDSNPAAVALREVLMNEWKRLGGGKADDLPDGVVRITVAPRP